MTLGQLTPDTLRFIADYYAKQNDDLPVLASLAKLNEALTIRDETTREPDREFEGDPDREFEECGVPARAPADSAPRPGDGVDCRDAARRAVALGKSI